jgi:hypothetical protein
MNSRKAIAILAELDPVRQERKPLPRHRVIQAVQPLAELDKSLLHRQGRGRLWRSFRGHRSPRRHARGDVRAEQVAGLAPFLRGERSEVSGLRVKPSDQRTDDFVRAPERHAAADQVVRDVGGQQQARGRRFGAIAVQ